MTNVDHGSHLYITVESGSLCWVVSIGDRETFCHYEDHYMANDAAEAWAFVADYLTITL